MPKSRAHSAEFRQLLQLLNLLGHAPRVVIMQRLASKPGSAGDLAQELPVSRTAVVQHLKLLETAGLVRASRDGKRRVYRVNGRSLAPLSRWIARVSRAD